MYLLNFGVFFAPPGCAANIDRSIADNNNDYDENFGNSLTELCRGHSISVQYYYYDIKTPGLRY